MMSYDDLKKLCDRLHEVNREYSVLLDSLREIMPCGHLARFSYPPTGDSGTTHFCLVCEYDAKKTVSLEVTSVIGQPYRGDFIADGFGNSWPRLCLKCGAPMVIRTVGDCRCSAECNTIDDRIMP